MARIKILELPSRQVGEAYETPFALIIDQTADEEPITFRAFTGDDVVQAPSTTAAVWQLPEVVTPLDAFAEKIGAAGVLVVPGTLDLA